MRSRRSDIHGFTMLGLRGERYEMHGAEKRCVAYVRMGSWGSVEQRREGGYGGDTKMSGEMVESVLVGLNFPLRFTGSRDMPRGLVWPLQIGGSYQGFGASIVAAAFPQGGEGAQKAQMIP